MIVFIQHSERSHYSESLATNGAGIEIANDFGEISLKKLFRINHRTTRSTEDDTRARCSIAYRTYHFSHNGLPSPNGVWPFEGHSNTKIFYKLQNVQGYLRDIKHNWQFLILIICS